MAWRWTTGAVAVAMSVAALAGGCAAGNEQPADGGGGSTTTATTGGGGTMGVGGTEAEGGSGGEGSLCNTDCSAIEAPTCFVTVCNDGSYQGTVGSCVVVPQDDGTECDDGLFCTLDDTCQAGQCVGGPTNDCGMVASECHGVVCDENSASCSEQPADDGAACVGSDLCLVGGQCANGNCIGGTPNDCFFSPVPDDCHVAVCNPQNGMCEPVPGNEGEACVDLNDLCTVNKTCTGGVCDGGAPKDCSQLTMGCDLGVCDTTTGTCVTQTVMNGQICDDLDACTLNEICTNGLCGGGTPVTNCSQTGDGCCPSNCTALDDIDCACSTDNLVAPYLGGNGLAGNMFDIVAKANIEIQGFDVSVATSATTIEIYYRPGTHVGFETSSTGWTLAGTAAVTGAGLNQPTPVPVSLSIQIPSGQTYGFYVTATTSVMDYTDGTTLGALLVENADLQILQGTGKSYPFGSSTFSPRNFNGTVHYEVCGN
ncbi:MAG: hypothetical protein R3B72_45265 [Polyangiaceae bacterium]